MRQTKVTLAQVMASVEQGGFEGFCIECGAKTDGVDPEAVREPCEACGCSGVYGAEQLLLEMEFF